MEFAAIVDNIGDGAGPDVNLNIIDAVNSTEDLISFVYPPQVLAHSVDCLCHAILAPTNIQVDEYNNRIIRHLPGHQKKFYAADTLQERNDAVDEFTGDDPLPTPDDILDYVARIRPKGMPDHTLTIKIGGVYRLLRNFSLDKGLVKNVRVVITGLGNCLITVHVLKSIGNQAVAETEDLLIPRITFKDPLSSGHTLLRRQFPLAPAYATTFHSCQGLTLDRISVDLTHPVFTHGQLYTALSRIRH